MPSIKNIIKRVLDKYNILQNGCLFLQLIKENNVNVYQSMKLSAKYRCNFIVYKGLKISIDRQAKIKICGTLKINLPWEGANTQEGTLIIREGASLIVNGYFRIYSGCYISIEKNAALMLSNGFINRNCNIRCFNSIKIANGCKISEEFMISDSDNHKICANQKCESKAIDIKEHVWIGLRCTLLKGITIGEGTVIAANSLVNKDVRPFTLVGGVPSKVIRENIEWK